MVGRTGPRPNAWKVKGEIPHKQHIAWLRAKAQAEFRGEVWTLTFDEYQQLWAEQWHNRGRKPENYCLTRYDSEQPWNTTNSVVMNRREHLQRQRQLATERNKK